MLRPHRRWVLAGLIAFAAAALAGVAWFLLRDDNGAEESSIPACPSSELTPLDLATGLVAADVPRYGDTGPFRFEVEEAG